MAKKKDDRRQKTQGGQLPPPLRDLPAGVRGSQQGGIGQQFPQLRQMPTLPQSMPGTDPAATDGMTQQTADGSIIGRDEILRAAETLREYKRGKQSLEQRIIANEEWYRTKHWNEINRKYGNTRTVTNDDGTTETVPRNHVEPSSAWLFNALANKHADIMDNYPAPVVLARERSDTDSAKTISAILPVIMERNDFEATYSDQSWEKLKSGTGVYGKFFNPELENGLGDIDIKGIDLLNVFWQPGITDIQQSRNFFHVALVDDDLLMEQYPQYKGKQVGGVIDVSQYRYDDQVDTTKKAAVVDWYYKRRSVTGKKILHLCKFVGDTILFASENKKEYQETGWYAHGEYPFDFDVLFPVKGTPCGFGFIDIMRDPQLYIDKLNQIILENAFLAGKARFFVRENGGVNEKEFADMSKDFVHVATQLNEDNLKQIVYNVLPNEFHSFLEFKVNELKETSGNRDFNQGSSASGVTAAAAIAALQEAGNKLSRDTIKGSYRSYRGICATCIELMRQFYDEARTFRITGENGQMDYTSFSNAALQDQPMPPAVPGADQQPGYAPDIRRPIFDVVIKAEKTNPFSRVSQNELALSLYDKGFFNPQMADQALGALDLMDFEGKEKVVERVSNGQTTLNIIMQMRQEMDKMAFIIQSLTGKDLLGQAQGGAESAQAQSGKKNSATTKSTAAQAQDRTTNTLSTSYADRLAARSKPDMSRINQGVKLK